MLALVFVGIILWAASIAENVLSQHEYLIDVYQSKARQHDMIRVAEALELYYRETNSFPASLPGLAATPGYEYLRSSLNSWQSLSVSPSLTDSVWTFRRAVAFTNDPTGGVTSSAYLASNECGIGGYDVATSWCGTKTSMWFRKETRDQFNEQVVTERARLNRLLQKFTDYKNTNDKYPDKDASNVALAASSITAIATLAGYAGTAITCTGQYQYQGIPIDCSDMFDSWGGKIGYQFESTSHIILVSETPIFNATGTRVFIPVDSAL